MYGKEVEHASIAGVAAVLDMHLGCYCISAKLSGSVRARALSFLLELRSRRSAGFAAKHTPDAAEYLLLPMDVSQ